MNRMCNIKLLEGTCFIKEVLNFEKLTNKLVCNSGLIDQSATESRYYLP